MVSLEQQTTTSRDIPGFDDGMVSIRELIRIIAESLVNEIMDEQAENTCGEGNQRNGYRERDLVASVGVIRCAYPSSGAAASSRRTFSFAARGWTGP